jgi:YD repeat-containing protein
MSMERSKLSLVLAAVVVSACASPSDVDWEQTYLSTDRSAYAIGQEAVVTLTNASGQTVRYSWCQLGLERRSDDGTWQHAGGAYLDKWVSDAQSVPNLTAIVGNECDLVELRSRGSVTYPISAMPSFLVPGPEYRYMIGTMGPQFEDRAIVYSSIFAITP